MQHTSGLKNTGSLTRLDNQGEEEQGAEKTSNLLAGAAVSPSIEIPETLAPVQVAVAAVQDQDAAEILVTSSQKNSPVLPIIGTGPRIKEKVLTEEQKAEKAKKEEQSFYSQRLYRFYKINTVYSLRPRTESTVSLPQTLFERSLVLQYAYQHENLKTPTKLTTCLQETLETVKEEVEPQDLEKTTAIASTTNKEAASKAPKEIIIPMTEAQKAAKASRAAKKVSVSLTKTVAELSAQPKPKPNPFAKAGVGIKKVPSKISNFAKTTFWALVDPEPQVVSLPLKEKNPIYKPSEAAVMEWSSDITDSSSAVDANFSELSDSDSDSKLGKVCEKKSDETQQVSKVKFDLSPKVSQTNLSDTLAESQGSVGIAAITAGLSEVGLNLNFDDLDNDADDECENEIQEQDLATISPVDKPASHKSTTSLLSKKSDKNRDKEPQPRVEKAAKTDKVPKMKRLWAVEKATGLDFEIYLPKSGIIHVEKIEDTDTSQGVKLYKNLYKPDKKDQLVSFIHQLSMEGSDKTTAVVLVTTKEKLEKKCKAILKFDD